MTATVEPGTARSPGVSYQELLDSDPRPVPEVLRLESPRFLGDEDIPVERFISREWHEREAARLWPRVWQFACREEHIPDVGSYVVYDIVNLSFVVMRTAPDEIKAYRNVCLHRGRQLKDYDGRCSELRCPYHGFSWQLDGRLKHIPARWDFPHVDARAWSLPEAKVDTWAGFVFINPDPEAGPLADVSATCPSTSALEPRGSLRPGPRGQDRSPPTGRSCRRRSASRSTPARRTRRRCRTSATSTARSMSGTRSAGSSRPAEPPARNCGGTRPRTTSSATCSTPESTRTRSSR